MQKIHEKSPEHTAVRVALWRALHVQIDSKPHVFTDEIGLKLIGDENWRKRSDMDPEFSKTMRASVAGRARFIDDLVEEQVKQGLAQYVILGAGLDTFAQRRDEFASRLDVFEVDQPGPQEWKIARLKELGLPMPKWLYFVPVDFEAGQSWWQRLMEAGFDVKKPALFVSAGVTMYLTKEANLATFKQIAQSVSNVTFATTFMLTLELLDEKERSIMEFVMKKAGESGTPFLSLFSPAQIMDMAKEAGFLTSAIVSGDEIYQKYFARRPDGLRAGRAEAFLVATSGTN